MEKIKTPKNAKIYYCEKCNFKCSKNSDWNRHITTAKHKKEINGNEWKSKIRTCEYCEKTFKTASGLWKHEQKCYRLQESPEQTPEIPAKLTDSAMIIELLKQNQEFKEMMLDQSRQIQETQSENQELQKQLIEAVKVSGSHIENQTNIHNNQKFNLQFFLNEQCKDAMNITDFINSVTLSLNDLENMGSSGYVNGISSIIIKELRGLDITKRPVHCSDAKRETLYIKDEDKWEKECPENTKMKTAIRTVEKKNIKLISEWTDKHPKFTNSTTKENDEYLQILIETMGGKGDYEKNKNKIIKNIAKEVIIEK